MKKGLIVVLMFLIISIALNIRLFYLWDSSIDNLYDEIATAYFIDHSILNHIQKNEYEKAVEILKDRTEKNGNIVAIICMERGCNDPRKK